MICETCHGSGKRMAIVADGRHGVIGTTLPCPECNGSGVASCCDAAGSSATPSFTCPRCGAVSYNLNDIRERYCGHCHAFVNDPAASYCDDRFPERPCDHCGKPYRGPAVYCSLECALADA